MTKALATEELNKKLYSILIRLNGNPEVLQELMDLMGNHLLNECENILKDYHKAEAELNTIWHKLYSKAGHYNPTRPALPYVVSVARNHCRDILRLKANKLDTVSIEDVGEIKLSGVPYSEDLVLDLCLSPEEKEEILNTMGDAFFDPTTADAREKLFTSLTEESS